MTLPVLKPIAAAVSRAAIHLRDYQEDLEFSIYDAWEGGADNVLAVLPTGGGKTVVVSKILHDHNGAACAIAHRQELVGQISLALARNGIRHRIIGPDSVVRMAVGRHMADVGASFYNPQSHIAVAGVDTLIRRGAKLAAWLQTVTLWITDEAHHILRGNKWGNACDMFPNARGLGVTATPERADGKGLGRHADGVFDAMVEGPTQRELINRGYLTPYKIYAPPCDLDLSGVTIGATGDYSPKGLSKAAKRSHIVGDVVDHYLRLAPGRRGVTFATDVETAETIAEKFREKGVPALAVSAKSTDQERDAAVRKLTNGEVLQLVNVDLFGEGFDLPAIEVVSFARPTQSYALFVQQAGRALRPAPGKTGAIIIDHVGNIARHATVVDRGGELVIELCHRQWTLDGRDRRSRTPSGEIPLATCPECTASYPRTLRGCPTCGFVPEPAGRSKPEEVDGDLSELDPAALASLKGEIARVDMPAEEYRDELARRGAPHVGVLANVKRHIERQEAQQALRECIAWWAGLQRSLGRSDSESYRRFFFKFGVDVMTAQTLKAAEARPLAEKIALALAES